MISGIVEGTEPCDGLVMGTCPGACRSDCTCLCTNEVADPKASVKVNTRKDIGKLAAKMVIELASYAGEPIVVRLDDGDTQPIAVCSFPSLPPLGSSGTKWQFKGKEGVQKVQLKNLAPKRPGMFQVVVKTKHWFTAAAANDTAPNTDLTVTVGARCFTHEVTKKTD